MSKIGFISDSHWRDHLGHSSLFEDKRDTEREEVKNAIVDAFKDCAMVIFNGDSLNSKNNSSKTLASFSEFLMRFKDSRVIVNTGNHEAGADGVSALGFLNELDLPNLTVVKTISTFHVGGKDVVVVPYYYLPQLGAETPEEGTKKLMSMLPDGDILSVHHAISGSTSTNGLSTDLFHEIVLPKEELEKKYGLILAGHIHDPQDRDKVHVIGCTFSNEIGDDKKRVITVDTDTLEVVSHWLPVRPILKLINPTANDLLSQQPNSILKVVLTKKYNEEEMKILKDLLSVFDAGMVVEQLPDTRRKIDFESGVLDFSVDNLLQIYSEERKVPLEKLKYAISLL